MDCCLTGGWRYGVTYKPFSKEPSAINDKQADCLSSSPTQFEKETISLITLLVTLILVISIFPSKLYAETFQWPLENPQMSEGGISVDGTNHDGNDYATYNDIKNFMYHTGVDMKSGKYDPSATEQQGNWKEYVTPVMATSTGTVVKVFKTSDTKYRCGGTILDRSTTLYNNNHGLGNVVVVKHDIGTETVHSLYGHLDCINPDINVGTTVSSTTHIGKMGHSGSGGRRDSTFNPHLHFEIKDNPAIGNDSDDGTYFGYTPDLPNGYGYHDPRVYIHPFSSTPFSSTPIKIISGPLKVRTGPGTIYAELTSVSISKSFVAFAKSGDWYLIDLPNTNGLTSGWIAGVFGGQVLAVEDPSATQIEVKDTGTLGLKLRSGAGTETTELEAWDNLYKKCLSAKIWDGQRFVTSTPTGQNNWYELDLPTNNYFDISTGCKSPSSPFFTGPLQGWSSGDFLTVIPGSGSCSSLVGQGAPTTDIQNKFIAAYNSDGGDSILGCPINAVGKFVHTFYSPSIIGYYQTYQGGTSGQAQITFILGYPAAYSIKSGFYLTFQSVDNGIGERVYTLLVAPTGSEISTDRFSVTGTNYNWQPFIKGSMYYYVSSPVVSDNRITYVWGDISDRYQREGGRTSSLGLPLLNQVRYGPFDGWDWWYQYFEKGFIWYAKQGDQRWSYAYRYTGSNVFQPGNWVGLGWCYHSAGLPLSCLPP